METPFSKRCRVLSELYVAFRDEKDMQGFEDFWKYNNIGLPLAWLIDNDIVTEVSELGVSCITETYEMLVVSLGLDPDTEYSGFEQIMEAAEQFQDFLSPS